MDQTLLLEFRLSALLIEPSTLFKLFYVILALLCYNKHSVYAARAHVHIDTICLWIHADMKQKKELPLRIL